MRKICTLPVKYPHVRETHQNSAGDGTEVMSGTSWRLPPRTGVTGALVTTAALLLVLGGCNDDDSSSSDSRDGLAPIPTRTTPPTASVVPATDPGGALQVNDFTVLPTFTCLKDTPPRSVVTVGWRAPSATGVELRLDGQLLPVGIKDQMPFQVPAGGPTGIGASVVFACDGPAQHTIDVTWTTNGIGSTSRTVTITKEPTDG